MEVVRKDYSKISQFERIGYTYSKIYEDSEYLVWKMSKEGEINYQVEVWKKRLAKNPDGSVITRAISDEEFGVSGWYLAGKEADVKKRVSEKFGITLNL